MQYHLLKRNPDINATRGKKRIEGLRWFVQKRFNGNPSGSRAEIGDIVYLYEKDYAVWGKGEVKIVENCVKIRDVNEYLDFVKRESAYKNDFFWGNLLLSEVYPKICEEESFFSIVEILIDVTSINEPFALPKKYNSQQSWMYLEDKDIYPEKMQIELKSKIPASLKAILYQEFSWDSGNYCVDIDHVVPASVGGPGNIKENLMPLGASINRNKINSVPAALFYVAFAEGIYKKKLPDSKRGLLKENHWKDEAKLITRTVNCDVEEAKKFYKKVRESYLGIRNGGICSCVKSTSVPSEES